MAKGLNRLNITSTKVDQHYKQTVQPKSLAKTFASVTENKQELPDSAFLLSFKILAQEQQKDQPLLNKVNGEGSKYTTNNFHGGEKDRLIIYLDEKIVVDALDTHQKNLERQKKQVTTQQE